MATRFPSLLPRSIDELWFSLEKRLDDDAILAKEEEEYTASLQAVIEKGCHILPIGKTKEQQETVEEEDEDDMEDDEDTGEELEDETDEYESPSPDAESAEGEVEMLDSSMM